MDKVTDINKKNVYTGRSKKGYGLTYFALNDFKPGERVMEGFGRYIDHQTPHCSVQIGLKKHYLPKKWTGKYWNHSCSANTFIKTLQNGFPALYAVKKIQKGDEITYPYYETEYAWIAQADEIRLKCKCGEENCKGKIFSFSQLTPGEQNKLRKAGTCSQYLLKGV